MTSPQQRVLCGNWNSGRSHRGRSPAVDDRHTLAVDIGYDTLAAQFAKVQSKVTERVDKTGATWS